MEGYGFFRIIGMGGGSSNVFEIVWRIDILVFVLVCFMEVI